MGHAFDMDCNDCVSGDRHRCRFSGRVTRKEGRNFHRGVLKLWDRQGHAGRGGEATGDLGRNGLQLTDGFLDHTTLHCWGLEDYTNGSGQGHGYCVGVDPAGDQFSFNLGPDEKHAPKELGRARPRSPPEPGNFAGSLVVQSMWFTAMNSGQWPRGTYVNYVTFQGHYKLP
jgi:hypothetical protein